MRLFRPMTEYVAEFARPARGWAAGPKDSTPGGGRWADGRWDDGTMGEEGEEEGVCCLRTRSTVESFYFGIIHGLNDLVFFTHNHLRRDERARRGGRGGWRRA